MRTANGGALQVRDLARLIDELVASLTREEVRIIVASHALLFTKLRPEERERLYAEIEGILNSKPDE